QSPGLALEQRNRLAVLVTDNQIEKAVAIHVAGHEKVGPRQHGKVIDARETSPTIAVEDRHTIGHRVGYREVNMTITVESAAHDGPRTQPNCDEEGRSKVASAVTGKDGDLVAVEIADGEIRIPVTIKIGNQQGTWFPANVERRTRYEPCVAVAEK